MVLPAAGAGVPRRRAPRPLPSITDRFGWSAFVLGGDSVVGRDLRDRFAADLAARSTGPVRVAFPGDDPDHESPDTTELLQRPEISAHVPCVVVVADPGVHVLPFAGREADDVHRLLADWIDLHHRENGALLERWTNREHEINRLLAALSATLRAARRRATRVRAARKSLRRLDKLSTAPPDDLDAVLADPKGLPGALITALTACRTRLRECAAVEAAGERMAAAARELAGSDDRRVIRRVLGRLTDDSALRLLLAPDAAERLAAARAAFGRDDAADVREWRAENGKLVTRPVFAAAAQAWRWIAHQGRLPLEPAHRTRRREYDAFARALAAQPLGPGAADGVLAALAAHHGVTDQAEWAAATAGFRAYLVDVVEWLRVGAPADFTSVGHCLPTSPPPVRPLTDELRELRDGLADVLLRDVPGPQADARRAVRESVPALAEEHRARVAATLAEPGPEPTGAAEAARLAELVEELAGYEDAVRSVVLPHLSDPAAVPVAAHPAALDGPPEQDPVDALRRVAEQTAAEYHSLRQPR
ncbi:hypothetical protein AB0I60_21225 [Actinosynnema sp. NPDC050436]|uniref:hypothetical protein n=1 Tax=Actinosynnema sp. NPDC050436 TaxID=3155659 RepID=UPI0033D34342